MAFIDQGDTGERPAAEVAARGMRLDVVTLPTARRGVVVLPHRQVVERSCAWMVRVHRLAPDDECGAETLAGVHVVAFAIVLARRCVSFVVQSS